MATTKLIKTYQDFDRYFEALKIRCRAEKIARIIRYEDVERMCSVFEFVAFRGDKVYRSSQMLSDVMIVEAYLPYQIMADTFEKAFIDLVKALKEVDT